MMETLKDISFFLLQCLYLALPGAFANMAPLLFRKTLGFLAVPVDMGLLWKGKPLFGKNKTVRGFITGIVLSTAVVLIQNYLYVRSAYARHLSLIPYSQINPFFLGFLLGFGVLFGDLMESFVKRRLGIPPGGRFFPWDQTDHLMGGLIFLSLVYVPPLKVVITLLFLAVVLSVVVKHVGFWLGIEKSKW